MFGKRSKMSVNEKAIIAIGKAAGNLHPNFGNSRGPAGKKGKETPDPYAKRAVSPGKAGVLDRD